MKSESVANCQDTIINELISSECKGFKFINQEYKTCTKDKPKY